MSRVVDATSACFAYNASCVVRIMRCTHDASNERARDPINHSTCNPQPAGSPTSQTYDQNRRSSDHSSTGVRINACPRSDRQKLFDRE